MFDPYLAVCYNSCHLLGYYYPHAFTLALCRTNVQKSSCRYHRYGLELGSSSKAPPSPLPLGYFAKLYLPRKGGLDDRATSRIRHEATAYACSFLIYIYIYMLRPCRLKCSRMRARSKALTWYLVRGFCRRNNEAAFSLLGGLSYEGSKRAGKWRDISHWGSLGKSWLVDTVVVVTLAEMVSLMTG